jgi:hypothetical protein
MRRCAIVITLPSSDVWGADAVARRSYDRDKVNRAGIAGGPNS